MISSSHIKNRNKKKFAKFVLEITLMGRMGNLKDFVRTLIYLLDENNYFISGQNIVVDGDRTLV